MKKSVGTQGGRLCGRYPVSRAARCNRRVGGGLCTHFASVARNQLRMNAQRALTPPQSNDYAVALQELVTGPLAAPVGVGSCHE